MKQEIINTGQPASRKRAGGGRAFHSRLEPFVEFIREQRQRRKTWKEIAAALSGEKGCSITAQGVHQFYRRHLQRHAKGHWEDDTAMVGKPQASAYKPVVAATPTSRPFRQPNADGINLNDPTKV